MLDYERFTSLNELLKAVSSVTIEGIRRHYDAVEVRIRGISFHTESNDGGAGTHVMIGENVKGWGQLPTT